MLKNGTAREWLFEKTVDILFLNTYTEEPGTPIKITPALFLARGDCMGDLDQLGRPEHPGPIKEDHGRTS